MDDLLALFDHQQEEQHAEEEHVNEREIEEPNVEPPRTDRIGFRITNRKMSSIDLMDYIADPVFRSAPVLAASSQQALNELLVEPNSTRTNLLTIGIVFSNSGTKVAASTGNAYCLLQLGTLRAGPCLSLLLFGSAYSKHCRSCPAGTVLLVRSPRIMNNNNNNNNKGGMSFSLNDEDQCINVGQAQDFGFCKAKVRGKDESGRWVEDARPCRNYVDTRQGQYCRDHQAKAREKSSASRMDTLRADMNTATGVGQKIMTGPTRVPPNAAQRSFTSSNLHHKLKASLSPARATTTSHVQSRVDTGTKRNTILNPNLRKGTTISSAAAAVPIRSNPNPYATQKSQPTSTLGGNRFAESRLRVPAASTTQQGTSNSILNPKRSLSTTLASRPVKSSKPMVHIKAVDPLGKALKSVTTTSTVKRSTSTGRKRLNTDVAGFDGSVPVPSNAGLSTARPKPLAGPTKTHAASLEEKKKEQILQRQRALAQTRSQAPPKLAKRKASKEPKEDNSFFATVNVDVEAARNRKSKFAMEADAENYVASLQKLNKLEEVEEKDKKRKKDDKGIKRVWTCQTCAREYHYEPGNCYRNGHTVNMGRVLSKRDGEKRSKPSDDSLKLGSGLEWSNFKRFD